MDPRALPAGGASSVYSAPHRFERAPQRRAFAGRIVHGAGEALAAAAEGADFLLVPAGGRSGAELAAIAAAGLPWYLEGEAHGAVAATGRLWWQATLPIGRL